MCPLQSIDVDIVATNTTGYRLSNLASLADSCNASRLTLHSTARQGSSSTLTHAAFIQESTHYSMTANLPGGAMTGGRSSPGMATVALLCPKPAVGSAFTACRGDATPILPWEVPPSRASLDLLAGVNGPGSLLHTLVQLPMLCAAGVCTCFWVEWTTTSFVVARGKKTCGACRETCQLVSMALAACCIHWSTYLALSHLLEPSLHALHIC